MVFSKAAQLENSEAIAEFSLASGAYKNACKRFSVMRLTLDRDDANDLELAQYHRAKKVFKEACRIYNTARQKYVAAVRQCVVYVPEPSNEDLYQTIIATDDKSVTNAVRKDAILRNTSPEEFEAILQSVRDRGFNTDHVTPRFVPTTDDPTCGDFEPI
jgi:hypothetical protein